MKLQLKQKLNKNQGNSFIVVVATISFLAVLVSAILVAVALCYRLKAYDINSKDNFYYLEKAMDEIYAGVGTDSMLHLNKAYNETIEVLVYYDTTSQSYITMDNEVANDLMKKTFIQLVKEDPHYLDSTVAAAHLQSFLSNLYDATNNPSGIQMAVTGNVTSTDESLTIANLVLKREAKYSTVNSESKGPKQDTFVQSITTDIVINQPEFNVNFDTVGSDLTDLYSFSIIADMGTVITGATNEVSIVGNIYSAADFYNKSYNDDNATKVNSYTSDELKKCNGLRQDSMYSGIYIDGSKNVQIVADRVIVPGSIAVMNSAELMVSHPNPAQVTDIWADSIVLGGYSLMKSATDSNLSGAHAKLRANAYISDDLELNAKASNFELTGQYYGYNYASLDNRTYTPECVNANGGRTFSLATPDTIKDGATLEGQAHYNSSAIIVNGEESELNLTGVTDMYIAGQAYIELSKQTTRHDTEPEVDKDGNVITDSKGNAKEKIYEVENKDGQTEVTTYDTYSYAEKTQKEDDNYTTKNNKDKTNIQDYRTGEAISVKSNQLAYLAPIPNSWIIDKDGEIYLKMNEKFYNNADFIKDNFDDLSKIPIIKSVISGKIYYFFDFSNSKKNDNVMNEFITAYADMFANVDPVTGLSDGEKYGLTDITDYEHFKVKMLNVRTDSALEDKGFDKGKRQTGSIYSNSAISILNGNKITIKSRSSSIAPLIKAATNINQSIAEQNAGLSTGETGQSTIFVGDANTQDAAVLAHDVTTKLQSQYKEVKSLLTNKSRDQQGINDAHAMEEKDITPINHFFDFTILDNISGSTKKEEFTLDSNYKVWLGKEDLKITASGSNVKLQGLIVCKGDVTFDPNITEFEGLIVAGGKVYVGKNDKQKMIFTANEEIIKSILKECDDSQIYSGNRNHFNVCELFKLYKSIYKAPTASGDVATESMKTMSAIQFEDIVGFENWMKNVD